MGNHLDLPAAASYGEHLSQITAQRDTHLTYKSTLGGSAFLRTFLYAHSDHGLAVVKVCRPDRIMQPRCCAAQCAPRRAAALPNA